VVTASKSVLNNVLLQTNVHALDGPGFERFLAAVFRNHRYAVSHIGKTGDQGADLIVQVGPTRIVVQAKCYSGSVGNSAVQEAHAGKGFHHCHRAMVVTNSYFTTSAIALARELGCGLIDGRSLPLLIRGKISIGRR
jgi:restriction system protein